MKALDVLMNVLSALLIGSTVVITFLAVFFRYVLNSALVWPEEIAGFLLVWISFIGAYLAHRHQGHLNFELLQERLSPRGSLYLKTAIEMVLVGFFTLILVLSVRMISVVGRTPIETSEIPQGLFMLILPIASSAMILACLATLSKLWRHRP